MGCCITFHDKCWKKYKKRQDDELKNFSELKKGFNTSLSEIKKYDGRDKGLGFIIES